jgi:hypothetical protein
MTMSHKEFLRLVFASDHDKTREFDGGVLTDTTRRMLDEVHKLRPNIIARASEIEALRHLPSGLIKALRAIGIFRMFVPRSHGGLELDLPSALEIIRELASIDGSVGWNAMIGSGGGIFAPYCRARFMIASIRTAPTRSLPVRPNRPGRPRRRVTTGESTGAGPSSAAACMRNGLRRYAR